MIDVLLASKTYDVWTTPADRLIAPGLRRIARKPVGSRLRAKLLADADRRHRTFHALHPISLQIRRGESWGIIGVNGSGKSTLLKMISGSLRPTTGRIEIDGKVAILDFSSGLNPDFSGRENAFLKAAIFGIPRRTVERRFDEIAAFADIGDFIDMPVKTYSSGMMARLGFAILAHVDADILITDEALAVGDAFFVQKCMRWIREFIERGTFLMVSHSINDIMSLCQKAVWLENGQVRAIGPAKEVGQDYLSSTTIRRSYRFKLLQDARSHAQALAEERAIEAARKLEEEERERVASPSRSDGTALKRSVVASSEIAQPELSALMEAEPARVIRDPRLEYMNRSPWRNDVKVTSFDSNARTLGVGGATIEDVYFEDLDGAELTWVIGGDVVRIAIVVRADQPIEAPLLGFQLKDRLGQVLFADNTAFANLDGNVCVRVGERVEARFEFQMPLLPAGEYVVRATAADGAVDSEAIVLSVVDNALALRCTTSGPRHGLVGVPMLRITLQTIDERPRAKQTLE